MVPWDFFDAIICINLADRKDKYEYMTTFARRLNIPLTFYHPIRDKISGEKGCYESHLKVIKHAWDQGWNNVLILEDDVLESRHFSDQHMNEAIKFMKNDDDWDLFMLGYGVNILKIPTKISNNIIKHKCYGTFAYVINRKSMPKILETPEYQGIGVDWYFQKFNQYLYYPIQFVTSLENTSDVPKVFGINHLLNTWFPNRIIVVNELTSHIIYYHAYIRIVIFSILLYIIYKRFYK